MVERDAVDRDPFPIRRAERTTAATQRVALAGKRTEPRRLATIRRYDAEPHRTVADQHEANVNHGAREIRVRELALLVRRLCRVEDARSIRRPAWLQVVPALR